MENMSNNKTEGIPIYNSENNTFAQMNPTTPKSKWNFTTIVIFIAAIATILGVIFIIKQGRDRLSAMYGDYEVEENITTIMGEWYAYDDETDELLFFSFENRNQCKIGVDSEIETCSFTYDENVIKIYEGKDDYVKFDAEYVEFSYSLKSSYLEIEHSGTRIKFYRSEKKAKKNPTNTNESNSGESENNENSINEILNKYPKEEFIKMCENIEYTSLARTPDNYKGKYIHFKGEVIQVQEYSTQKLAVLRVNTKLSDYDYIENFYEDDTVYVVIYNYDMNNRILEEDIIDMYGIYYGIETYETVLGSTISIPAMVTVYYSIN